MLGYAGGFIGLKNRPIFDTNQRTAVLNSIERLEKIRLDVRQPVRRAANNPPLQEWQQDQLLIVMDREGPERLKGEILVKIIIFQPGRVFRPFLLGPGRQTAPLSMKALAYNPDTQKYEKRMARYLSWLWRIRAKRDDGAQPHKVGTLLEAVDLRVNGRNPSQTYERLEQLLDRLEKDQVITSWEYRDWDEAAVGKRGWVSRWLEAGMVLAPPQPRE